MNKEQLNKQLEDLRKLLKLGEEILAKQDEEKPVKTEIRITTDGVKNVYATLTEDGKVVKKSKATCSDEDEFDFKHGSNLAFQRLVNKCDEITSVLTFTFGEDSFEMTGTNCGIENRFNAAASIVVELSKSLKEPVPKILAIIATAIATAND